jgi:RNA polymerase sigma-70 factor (ECF subfamily)
VSATPKTGAEQGECTSGTLGDLVYSDKTRARVSEEDWLAILQCIVAGDRRALRALYERTHPIVFTLVMRVLDNRQSAEEVTLDVFHEVWTQAATYDRSVGSVLGWITSLAKSKATERMRLEQRSRYGVLPDASLAHEAPFPATSAAHGGGALERNIQAHFLPHALTVLAPEERQVIETALFSESTYVEMATQLCQPPGTVRTRIRYGLAKLRMALTREDETQAS